MLDFLSHSDTKTKMNKLGQDNRPFLFIIRYDKSKNLVIPLDELDSDLIKFDLSNKSLNQEVDFGLSPETLQYETYLSAFNHVRQNILAGNSFLTNLTVSVPLANELNLFMVFNNARAKFKLWIKDVLVCFSPEIFVNVSSKGEIATFPMKGTIDASEKNALEKLTADKKELYEHTTVVDLLRNDLSQIADEVRVERFRYADKIKREDGSEILQMSSEIRGQLPTNWKDTIGDWLMELLPAGSISGAPKPKTLETIKEAERFLHKNGERGFYTGVFGIFDGESLSSAVMIRFIENTENGLVFKSGGGITHLSDPEKEFKEIYQKLYIPMG